MVKLHQLSRSMSNQLPNVYYDLPVETLFYLSTGSMGELSLTLNSSNFLVFKVK